MRVIGNRTGTAAAVVSLVAGLAVVVAAPARAATTINVPSAQPTIQAGIDAAANGDTVVVAPGTYSEHIDFKGKAIEVKSSAGAATTIIDGGGTSIAVAFRTGEGRTSILRGFTVTHGLIPFSGGPGLLAGGGIGIQNASPTITENIVTANDASVHEGAGIGSIGGAPLIVNNAVRSNTTAATGAGGGIFAGDGAEIVNNVIENNTAGGGGGIVIYGGTPTVRDNIIRGNHSLAFDGGGVRVGGGLAGGGGLFVNNVITGNIADGTGGGVFLTTTGTANPPYFLNNTIVQNSAAIGSGIAVQGDAATLVNDIIIGASSTSAVWCAPTAAANVVVSHSDVYNLTASPYQGCADATGTAGNISADALVVAPPSGNYGVQAASPAIDAGDNAAASLPATDQLGATRVTDGNGDGLTIVDMGAVESAAVPVTGDRFHPLTPARILDTRIGQGAPMAPLGAGASMHVQVTGQGGVPASGVTAVVLNVTVTQPTVGGFLTVWPTGVAQPVVSNLNFVNGQTVPNLVVVKVGAGGQVDMYNNHGTTHVVADVFGWYGGPSTGSRYFGLAPARILDTRIGVGAPTAKLGSGASMHLQVTGQGGVPATGVSAVVLNVTVTQPTIGGFLTAWPTGVTRPLVSNLNFVNGQTVANLVMVQVGAGGQIDLYNNNGLTDVVADVAGYFGPDGGPGGAGFNTDTPSRILDTRIGLGAPQAKLGTSSTISLQVAGQGGVPATGVTSVILNATATEPTAESFLTVWPEGISRPLVSNLNYLAGQTVPNLATVKMGAGGKVDLYNNSGSTDVVVDVFGWYSG